MIDINRTGYNNLSIKIYESFSALLRTEAIGDMLGARSLSVSTFFPGGLYGLASFFVPRKPISKLPYRESNRVIIFNGLTVVWEGQIINIARIFGNGANQGVRVTCAGYWKTLLGKRSVSKPWVDTGVGSNAWIIDTAATGFEKASVDRMDRIRLTPNSKSWISGEFAAIGYFAPTGQTIKKVVMARDLQEGGQQWELRLRDRTNAITIWSLVVSTVSAKSTFVLGTPTDSVYLEFFARANQTAGNSKYGEISEVEIYTETSAIQIDEIAKDVAGLVPEISTDLTRIETPASPISLVPFITGYTQKSMASILVKAASFGDASSNQWYAQLREASFGNVKDEKPVLIVNQWPDIDDDYEYAIHEEEDNLQTPFGVITDGSKIVNWVMVKYRDIDNQRNITLTPDDDASLKDQESIDKYGELHLEDPFDIGEADSAIALNIGQRILEANKSPKVGVTGPIIVKGAIRGRRGNLVPVSQIKSGERIKIETVLEDISNSENGLIFIITGTRYNDMVEVVTLSTGVPDNLSITIAQLRAGF